MRLRKKMTATQVTAVTNSYMSPHGTRCTASPRVVTPITWAASPRTFSARATRTQAPAGSREPRPRSVRPTAEGSPGVAATGPDPGTGPDSPGAPDTDPAPAPAAAVAAGTPAVTPAVTSCGTWGAAGSALDECRPKAKSPA